MSVLGALNLVLQGHQPYVTQRQHGEIGLYEVIHTTYLPLLKTLYDLHDNGIPFALTVCLSPVLAEQLTNPRVIDQFDAYLNKKIAAAQADIQFFEDNDAHLSYLADWYLRLFEQTRTWFHDRIERDIIGAFRQLQDAGVIEIATTAATHAYLPLLGHDSAITAQLKTGIATHTRLFGQAPSAIWLPECGYRFGLENFLIREQLTVMFCEPHMLVGGPPIGVAAGDVIGPLGIIKQHYALPDTDKRPETDRTTNQAYWLAAAQEQPTNLAVIGRNDRATMQVWGALMGYPDDVDYRENKRRIGTSGLHYWRITGKDIDRHDKDNYHPDWATYKVDQHAEHFAHLIGDMVRDHQLNTGDFALISAHFDMRLFGEWWFEGSQWLGQVLKHLAQNETIELTTATTHIQKRPPQDSVQLAAGSWGMGGGDFTWDNPEVRWLWPPIHTAEARMEQLAAQFSKPSADEEQVLNQAARELLLLQSSDWAFLITARLDREYAIQTVGQHLEQFDKLANSLEAGEPAVELARAYWTQDPLFADIDYRVFDIS